jgi:hypothetical protein
MQTSKYETRKCKLAATPSVGAAVMNCVHANRLSLCSHKGVFALHRCARRSTLATQTGLSPQH